MSLSKEELEEHVKILNTQLYKKLKNLFYSLSYLFLIVIFLILMIDQNSQYYIIIGYIFNLVYIIFSLLVVFSTISLYLCYKVTKFVKGLSE